MQRLVLTVICVFINTSLTPNSQAGGLSNTKNIIDSGTLANGLINQHESLTALSLVYDLAPNNGPAELPGAYSRRILAASRPGYYLRDNGHAHDRLELTDDPWRKTLLITPTEATLLENLNRVLDQINIDHSGKAPEQIDDLIFRALCWWPFANWSPPEVHGRPWSMTYLLKGGAYRLRPQQETIGSRLCYVLEVKGLDVIWVDCERPRCVLRRDIYNPAARSVASRFEMTDYRDVGDDIWLPGRLRNLQFDSNADSPSFRTRVVIDTNFLIHDIRVNGAVEPGTFRLNLEPGTVRRVVLQGEERFEPVRDGQAEHFQALIAWSRKNIRWPKTSAARIWVFAALGMVAGGLAVALTQRLTISQARSANVARCSGEN